MGRGGEERWGRGNEDRKWDERWKKEKRWKGGEEVRKIGEEDKGKRVLEELRRRGEEVRMRRREED